VLTDLGNLDLGLSSVKAGDVRVKRRWPCEYLARSCLREDQGRGP
jgi:hypothetical protein